MRRHFLLLAGILVLFAGSVLGQEPAVKPEGKTGDSALDLLGDVVDGVGGVLKILAGPPLSPPPPLNLPAVSAPPPPPKPVVMVPAALPPPLPPAEPALPPVTPAVSASPKPVPPVSPATPAVIKTPPPPVVPVARPPVTRPAASPVLPPPPAEPGCRTRAAATATLEQAAKLPRCGS